MSFPDLASTISCPLVPRFVLAPAVWHLCGVNWDCPLRNLRLLCAEALAVLQCLVAVRLDVPQLETHRYLLKLAH